MSEFYNLPVHSVGSGTINKITVKARASVVTVGDSIKMQIGLLFMDGEDELFLACNSNEKFPSQANTFENFSYEWVLNPFTELAWTWGDIDGLKLGIRLIDQIGQNADLKCTQIWVEVDYYNTNYSRGSYASLNADDVDLDTIYSAQERIDVSTNDEIRVSQLSPLDEYAVHQFKNDVGTADEVLIEWEGQTSWDSAGDIILEIYNRDTSSWEILATEEPEVPV